MCEENERDDGDDGDDLSEEVRGYLSRNGRKGAEARWSGTGRPERAAHGRRMAAARWRGAKGHRGTGSGTSGSTGGASV